MTFRTLTPLYDLAADSTTSAFYLFTLGQPSATVKRRPSSFLESREGDFCLQPERRWLWPMDPHRRVQQNVIRYIREIEAGD